MTMQELAQLRSQPFLRGMPPDQLAELARLSRHVTFPAGQRLFEEDSTADTFWIIDAGQVTLDASVPGQGRVTIETLGRNERAGHVLAGAAVPVAVRGSHGGRRAGLRV